VGFSWETYVLAFVAETRGWAPLSDELCRRADNIPGFPNDLQVIEKGLRRLAKRGHKSGGQYGRWMLRFFGIPASLALWAQWMGQLHSRFADLPASLRFEQLSQWDRPPVSESRVAGWIHVGIADVLVRMRRDEDAARRLAMAERVAAQAGTACELEVLLHRSKRLTDDGDRAQARALFVEADRCLDRALPEEDRRCYHARLVGQRAYHLTRPEPGSTVQPDLDGALAHFESISDEPFVPFVAFRKCNGLAYCHWQRGDVERGIGYARLAEQHAGDGGFVRFRIRALNLLARMLPDADAGAVRTRAERLAQLLEDEDLLRRLRVHWSGQ
jgi:hypothetical protein